jgi:hypothetical protein
MKDVEATGKVLSSQKRMVNTSKHELSLLCLIFCETVLPSWIRIRIPITGYNTELGTAGLPGNVRYRYMLSG